MTCMRLIFPVSFHRIAIEASSTGTKLVMTLSAKAELAQSYSAQAMIGRLKAMEQGG